ncbi:MAG: hypothetical protein E6R04_06190 [Spirochaetes bacterium]|nr:MAG: hypothetical protein E6R04_06190 [Spirochaetota bacterium]
MAYVRTKPLRPQSIARILRNNGVTLHVKGQRGFAEREATRVVCSSMIVAGDTMDRRIADQMDRAEKVLRNAGYQLRRFDRSVVVTGRTDGIR